MPDDAVRRVNEGGTVPDVWKCLQCRRCSMHCPEGIDVAGMVCALRNETSAGGDVPERFRRTAQQMCKVHKVFQTIGRTEVQRTEMGLSNDRMPQSETDEIARRLKEAGFDHE